MTRKTDPPRIDHLVRLYEGGKTYREAAAIVGVNPETARKLLNERGVPLDKTRYPRTTISLDVHEIAAAYRMGESEQSIASRLNVSRPVIRHRLVGAGVPIRGRRESQLVRQSNLTTAEKKAQTQAANTAARGRKASFEERRKRAQTRERKQSGVTEAERHFAEMLENRGIRTVLQRAVGPYNVDIAAGPVAVEIFGGNWHGSGRHLARAPKRFRYLLDQGWPFIIVWADARHAPLLTDAANYIVGFTEMVRRNPAARREYRVIWGTGEEATPVKPQLDKIAHIPSLAGRDRGRS